MITLNTDKGLVRLQSWADVEARPGFTPNIDPRTAKLDRIIGSYALTPFQPCGLSTCHTPHGKGYLVTTTDGHETNIGKDCGKKYFDVEFKRLAKAYDREERSSRRRETLTALQHQIPTIEDRIAGLMDGPTGAKWISKRTKCLTDPMKGLPPSIIAIIGGVIRRRNGTLTKTRVATAQELERMRVQRQRLQEGENYVEEIVGQLDGISVLYKENDLRRLLVTDMENLSVVKGLDVDDLKDKALRDLAKWSESIEPTLAQAEESIAAGRRLLTQANIRQLLAFIPKREDQRVLQAFIAELPDVQALAA
jgi:hypothetical protein